MLNLLLPFDVRFLARFHGLDYRAFARHVDFLALVNGGNNPFPCA